MINPTSPEPPPTMVIAEGHWTGCTACGGYGVERCKTCGKVDPECKCTDNPWDDCSYCGGTMQVWVGPTN